MTDTQKSAAIAKLKDDGAKWYAANCGANAKDQDEEIAFPAEGNPAAVKPQTEKPKEEAKPAGPSKLHPDVRAGKLTAWMLKEINAQNPAQMSEADKKTHGKTPVACQKFHMWAMSKVAIFTNPKMGFSAEEKKIATSFLMTQMKKWSDKNKCGWNKKPAGKLHPDVIKGKITAWMLKEIKAQDTTKMTAEDKKKYGKQPVACQKFHMWAMSKYAIFTNPKNGFSKEE